MSIEFRPPSLGRIINDQNAEKRLKNREGLARAVNEKGQPTGWEREGPIMNLHQEAVDYDIRNPNHKVVLNEYTCGSTVVFQRDIHTLPI
jgi:hypothetical protein